MRYFTLSLLVFLTACGGNQEPEVISAPAPAPTATDLVIEAPLEADAAGVVRLDVTSDFLLGKAPAQVMKMVGAPSLVRRDNLMQHMLFEADACVLDVVYYAADAGAPYVASFVSARDKGSSAYDASACLAAQLPEGWLWEPPLDERGDAPQTAVKIKPVEVSEQ